ncbi:MAG: VCBS repeat-containing protein [bacterium]
MSHRFCSLACVSLVLSSASLAKAEAPFIYTGEASRPALNALPPASGPPVPPVPSSSWPAAIGENFSSPMFFDLDGDGVLEVITTDRAQTYVFAADGSLRPGWPKPGGSDNIPAVADIDEDASPEILVASPVPPRICCFNVDGTVQAGFPVSLPYRSWLNATCPAIADVDGDGHLDVGAQSEGGVAFFDRFGHPLPGWPYLWATTQNIAWSAPAVADLDGDGSCEVVVGNNCLYACSVHVIRSDGTAMPGWPRTTNNIFASPAVGDLDGDGDLEIVVQEGDNTWYGNLLHAWHHDGRYVEGWPIEIAPQWESSRSNPAIADIDHNGKLEIVAQTSDGMLHVLDLHGVEWPGYPRALTAGSISSVQVIDMDMDGVAEFFLCFYASGSQWVSGWRLNGTTLPGFPKLLFANSQLDAHSSAHLADLEGDGDLDLCVQGGTFGAGQVCVYEVPGSTWQEQTGRRDWPKIRRDTANSGYCPRNAITAVSEAPARAPSLRCYPNPMRRGGTLSLQLPDDRGGRVAVFDLAGRRRGGAAIDRVPEASFAGRALFGTEPAAGVYFLRVEGTGGGWTRSTRLVILD